jgi:phosphate transport system permease protein
MALAMLIGNANQISLSLFSPANTLASLLASQWPEAGQIEQQALMYAALALLGVTVVVNVLGALIMSFTSRQQVT